LQSRLRNHLTKHKTKRTRTANKPNGKGSGSDTDLIPAIAKAQEKGTTVIYVAFSHQVSKALVSACKETQTLTKETLVPFLQPQEQATEHL